MNVENTIVTVWTVHKMCFKQGYWIVIVYSHYGNSYSSLYLLKCIFRHKIIIEIVTICGLIMIYLHMSVWLSLLVETGKEYKVISLNILQDTCYTCINSLHHLSLFHPQQLVFTQVYGYDIWLWFPEAIDLPFKSSRPKSSWMLSFIEIIIC